jgi:pyruvate kinase
MVARGDLGIEIPLERVPTVQRQLLALAGRHSRPSITATQMLASMVASPTREPRSQTSPPRSSRERTR